MKFISLPGSFHSKSRILSILKNVEGLFLDHEVETLKLHEPPFYSEDLKVEKPEITRAWAYF